MLPEMAGRGENRLLLLCLRAARRNVLACAGSLAALVSLLDFAIGLDVSLGAFYVIPVILASTSLNRPAILGVAAICAVLRVAFNPAHTGLEIVLGFLMAWLAYLSAGLFVAELVRNRKLTLRHMEEIRKQQQLRAEAEEQLRLLADSSPAAIMTIDGDGRLLAANLAAHDLLAYPAGQSLVGAEIGAYIPVLADVLKVDSGTVDFRTAAQCRGKRYTGETFFAHTWFSTYTSETGRRVAAIAVDSSEEMREREEQNLQQLLRTNRVVAGAVSHDIRNMCGAIAVVYSNLKREPAPRESDDFIALGRLIEGLGKIAAAELGSRKSDDNARVDLTDVLEQLRVMIAPAWSEGACELLWDVPEASTFVHGDLTALLQVFLNLASNSLRAVQDGAERRLQVSVQRTASRYLVRFRDTGHGLQQTEALFQPFQPHAQGSGMGLFVSRAVVRSFGGELRHEPTATGCCFVVELQAVSMEAAA